jgi:hypothetical protein
MGQEGQEGPDQARRLQASPPWLGSGQFSAGDDGRAASGLPHGSWGGSCVILRGRNVGKPCGRYSR